MPVQEKGCDNRYESCLGMQQGFHFGLDFQFQANVSFTAHDGRVELLGADRHSGALLYEGSCYSSGTDHLVDIRVEGPGAGRSVEFFIDDWRTPLEPLAGTGQDGAVWTPGRNQIGVVLPVGDHCLLYKVNVIPGQDLLPGIVRLEHSRRRSLLSEEMASAHTGGVPWIVMALIAGALRG